VREAALDRDLQTVEVHRTSTDHVTLQKHIMGSKPTRSGGPSAPDRVVEPEASGGGLRLEAVLTIGWGAHDFDATLASHTSIYNSRKLTAPQQR
jgi:hypothetical protein